MSKRRWSGGVVLGLLILTPSTQAAAPPVPAAFVQAQLQRANRLEGEATRHALAGRFIDALPLHAQALAVRRRWLAEKDPVLLTSRGLVEQTRRLVGLSPDAQKEVGAAFRHRIRGGQLRRLARYAQAEKVERQSLALLRKALGEDHPETAGAYDGVALCLYAQGRQARALPLYERALAIRRQALGEDHPDTATSCNNVASCLQALGRHGRALALCERALRIRRQALGEDHPSTAASYTGMAGCLDAQGRHDRALPLYETALRINRKALGEEHRNTATCYNNVAACLDAQGLHARALPLYGKALRIYRKAMGEDHPFTATSYNNLAACLVKQGRHARALPLYETALRICRKVLGEEHPDTAISYNNLAACLSAQGLHARALPLFETALRINRKALGEDHPLTAAGYNNVAYSLDRQGLHALALPLYEAALRIHRKAMGEDHPFTATSCNNLASCLRAQGLHARALPLYERALRIRRKVLSEEHPDTATSFNNLALCLHSQGRQARALPLFEKALRIRRKVLSEEHPDTATSFNNLAGCLWSLHRRREAVRLWQVAAPVHEAVRGLTSSGGFGRAQFAAANAPTHEALAVGLAATGLPRLAFRHAEAHHARGLLDDLFGGAGAAGDEDARGRLRRLDERLTPLLTSSDLPAERRRLRDELLRQRRSLLAERARQAAEAAERLLLPTTAIQAEIPADAALVLFVDVPVMGEYWACVLRRQGPPAWQRLAGSGPEGAWTKQDRALADRLHASLSQPEKDDPRELIASFRKQTLAPLQPHLGASHGLPAARRLFVVPTGRLARVPVEVLAEGFSVSYVPSATLFARLRQGHRPLRGSSLLALGDPVFARAGLPEPPEQGVLLLAVLPGGAASRAGLRSGDVLLRCGKRRLSSLAELKESLQGGAATFRVWREGREFDARLDGWPLGTSLSRRPRAAIRERRKADATLAAREPEYKALPGTRWEVEAIARLLPGSRTLLGSAASEQELDRLGAKEGLKRFRFLHFATHGAADEGDPDRSALILAQDRLPDALAQARAGEKVYDGRLTVQTIRATWALDADLVVLSACETALGRDTRGDGLLGFAHAFLSRGARSVVLSRWQVDDAATALLMLRFYENLLGKRKGLKADKGRAEALAEAKAWLRNLSRREAEALVATLTNGEIRGTVGDAPKKKLIAKAKVPAGDKPYGHPFYWAAFVLIGDPD
jgi:tetratricopeptide (TPR) repeat protein